MEIFYINLDKDVARRESMKRQLTELGLSYQRIEAVYGRDLSEEQLRAIYSEKKALRRHSMKLVPAHIGCSASQLLAYREIVRRDLPYALILEDDVILPIDLPDKLLEIEGHIRVGHPEVLLLSPAKGRMLCQDDVRTSERFSVAPFISGYFCSSYIVTNLAAQSLLKELHPVGDVADCWARLNRFKVVDLYAVQPHLIEQEQETFGSSTNADFKPFANSFTKALYKLRRLRCVVLDRLSAPWRRRFHPYNDVLKQK